MRSDSANLQAQLEGMERLKINLQDTKEQNQVDFDTLKYKMNLDYNKAINEAKEAIKTKDISEAHRHLNRAHEFKKAVKREIVDTKPIPLVVGIKLNMEVQKEF